MVQGKFKSGHYRRVHVRLPGGTTELKFKERTSKQPHCADCGRPLPGIPRMNTTEAKNAAKTQKRPERPFGGVLCSPCLRKRMTEQLK